jgi:branched-chain amino acid transport system substrate-binding protein
MAMKHVLALVGFLAAACAATSATAAEIKVGYLLPLTGGGAEYGQRQLKGANLAIEEFNKQNAGFTIKLITSDTKCTPVEGANAAERLVERDGVEVMIGGSCSPEAIAALRVTQKAKIPHIVPAAAATSITEEGNQFVFRIVPNTKQIAENLADVLADRIKVKQVATVYLNDDFGIDLNTNFVKRGESKGIKILAQEGIERTTMDFFSTVAKLKPLAPEYVVAPLFNKPAAQLARTMREQGMTAPVSDTIMLTDEFHQLAGPAAYGTIQTTFFHPTVKTEIGRSFVERFKAKYAGELPGNFEAEGYDAAMLAIDALKRSGADKGVSKEKVTAALRETRNFPGVMGPITFDAKGQVVAVASKFVLIRNNNGKVEAMD